MKIDASVVATFNRLETNYVLGFMMKKEKKSVRDM